MRIRLVSITLFLLITSFLNAQQLSNMDYGAYIKEYKSVAVREMKLYKIPASITLAQGMIESGCGKSMLARNTKNHFGIKCQNDWSGDTYLHDDDKEKECFRKYQDVDESFRDHSIFLTTRKRYSALFELPLNDYKGWAKGLKQAGYATNPDYPNILIRLIETNKLYLLDDTLVKPEAVAQNVPSSKASDEIIQPDSKNGSTVNDEGYLIFSKNYKMPNASGYKVLYTSDLGRKVYGNSNVPFIFAQKDDTWYSIAKEFRILIFQVYRQNDLKKSDPITPGQILYLEAKKKNNSGGTYKVKKGDTMYSISQEKCIKLPHLLKYNYLQPGDEPNPGVVLKLSK